MFGYAKSYVPTIKPREGHHPPLNNIVTTQDIIAGDVFFEITEPFSLEYTYRLRPAKNFGTSFSKPLEGVALVPAIPSHGCIKLENNHALRGNVALIDRGQCSFLTKTINAEDAGARAAIITEFNSESNEFDYYIEMIHDETNRDAHIPAGYLLGSNGVAIRNTLRRLKRTYARINLPVNLTFVPPSRINHPPWLDF
ncbi:PRADC1-like protein [Lucilia cuprina]|uniref:PRADC1-like protein n=1 Tax=Lucilia cuprina TaxID=7375 RepID=A0A0L0CRM8_LUCCU|nr:PRADC1-like protein [Lucilia cuprina]